MASTTKIAPQKEEVPEKEGADTPPDCPLLDLSDVAVRKLIRNAKKRGYVRVDQINRSCPRKKSIPNKSRTCSPCSARWA